MILRKEYPKFNYFKMKLPLISFFLVMTFIFTGCGNDKSYQGSYLFQDKASKNWQLDIVNLDKGAYLFQSNADFSYSGKWKKIVLQKASKETGEISYLEITFTDYVPDIYFQVNILNQNSTLYLKDNVIYPNKEAMDNNVNGLTTTFNSFDIQTYGHYYLDSDQTEGSYQDENGNAYYLDQNGNPYYLDQNGNAYYLDQNGNAYYLDQNGNAYYLDQNGNAYYLDQNGNAYYLDQNGNAYYLDQNGNAYYLDQNGNPYYLDQNGNPYYLDQNSNAYYLDENGYAFYLDENGNAYYLDQNGNPYYLDQNGNAYYPNN